MPNDILDSYLRNLSSLSRALAIAKIFSWLAWAVLFIWTAYKNITLGWLILLCLLGTWLVVKLSHDYEEMSRRTDVMEKERDIQRGEEAFQKELNALELLERTDFAQRLDAEWEQIRSKRGIKYSDKAPTSYTDPLGRPLSGSVLHSLFVERLRLIVKLALEKPEDYKIFHGYLVVGNPYVASSLPTPEDIQSHPDASNVTEFLKAWKGLGDPALAK